MKRANDPGKRIPPKLADVVGYLKKKGVSNPEEEGRRFWNYNDALGWKVGKFKTPMSNWQSSIEVWLDNKKRMSGGDTPPAPKPSTPPEYKRIAEVIFQSPKIKKELGKAFPVSRGMINELEWLAENIVRDMPFPPSDAKLRDYAIQCLLKLSIQNK